MGEDVALQLGDIRIVSGIGRLDGSIDTLKDASLQRLDCRCIGNARVEQALAKRRNRIGNLGRSHLRLRDIVAGIAQQIWYRYYHGQTSNPAFAMFGPAVQFLVARCEKLID